MRSELKNTAERFFCISTEFDASLTSHEFFAEPLPAFPY